MYYENSNTDETYIDVIFDICKHVCTEKLSIIFEKSEVQKANLYDRLDMQIVFSFIQLIKRTAEILQGSFRPVTMIQNLHFKIHLGIVIKQHTNIQYKIFGSNILS